MMNNASIEKGLKKNLRMYVCLKEKEVRQALYKKQMLSGAKLFKSDDRHARSVMDSVLS